MVDSRKNKSQRNRAKQQSKRQSTGGDSSVPLPPSGKDRSFVAPEPNQLPEHRAASRIPIVTTGPHALNQIVQGCKVWVDRPGEPEPRKAEILGIRERKRPKGVKDEGPLTEYYVHFVLFNKRLDEWVPGSRLLVDREVEWPIAGGNTAPATPQKVGTATRGSGSQTPIEPVASASSTSLLRKAATRAASQRRTSRMQSMSVDGDSTMDGEAEGDEEDEEEAADEDAEGEDEDAEGEPDEFAAAIAGSARQAPTLSKGEEIEKLRTQGSMTQAVHEVARVKNLDKISMGKHVVEAWYFSPYPVEYAHVPMLWICEFCLCFYDSEKRMERHRAKCTLVHPPGNEIYRHEDISFFEIDGRKQKTWCRNLGLLSKAFLDHKTLYYDVDPFLFYVMTRRDAAGHHMTGYFSKEKESAEGYNLACILTLPQYQKGGYGRLLIEFSYELSKKENKLGSPEKPLSDLGLISYRAYWSEIIVEVLLNYQDTEVTIDDIAQRTSLLHADIINTMQFMGILKTIKNNYVISLSETVLQQHDKKITKPRRHINPNALLWTVRGYFCFL